MNEVINSIAKVYAFNGLYNSRTLPHVVVADSVLQSYAGEYHLTPRFTLTITREGSHLYGEGTGQLRFELSPEPQNRFYFNIGSLIELEFIKDERGRTVKLVLYQGGAHESSSKARRICHKPGFKHNT